MIDRNFIDSAALLTHKNCMDGSSCAILFSIVGGKRENIFFSPPHEKNVDEAFLGLHETWDGPIIIADLSVSKGVAKKVTRNDIVLLDHHDDAKKLLSFPWCEVEVHNQRCGGKMLYDWLMLNHFHTTTESANNLVRYKEFINLVDDRDRWQNDYNQSAILESLHGILGQKHFIDRFVKNTDISFTPEEQYLLSLDETKKEEYIKECKKNMIISTKEIQGEVCRVAFVSGRKYRNALAEAIYTDPLLDIDVVFMVGDKNVSVRLRSDKDINLGKFMRQFCGGGHKKSAGCSLDELLGKSFLELVSGKLVEKMG